MRNFRNKNKFDILNPASQAEVRIIFYEYRRNAETLWDDQTPVADGMASADQLLKKFDERTDPEVISINHPDEVIFGVRSQMMQGPFKNNDPKILEGSDVHNERVINRLRNIYASAPEAYQHIIDEEYRRRATTGGKWQRFKRFFKSRRSIEEDIAKDFFTYDIKKPETYEDLRKRIQGEIVTLGVAQAGKIVDADMKPIDFNDPRATNEFVVAVGAAPKFRDERVVIRWHQDDFITIKKNLERAGLWGEFSRSEKTSDPRTENTRKFIHLKFRLSLLDKVVTEEKTKLGDSRFNTQRLKTWLDNDLTTQALRDTEMQDFINTNAIATTYMDLEDMQNTNPDLYRQFTNKIEELRQKNKSKSIEYYLSRILPAEELDHMHDSLEARTMIAYLQGAAEDPVEGMNTRRYLMGLAGVKEKPTAGTITQEQIDEMGEHSKTIDYFSKNYRKDYSIYKTIEKEIIDLTGKIGTGGSKTQLAAWRKRVDDLEPKRDEFKENLAEKIWEFMVLLNDKKGDATFDKVRDDTSGGSRSKLVDNIILNKRPPATPHNAYFDELNEYFARMGFNNELKTLVGNLAKGKTKLEEDFKKQEEEKAQSETECEPKKMDSRNLLRSLMELDLKRMGVTNPETLKKQALFATNMAIAKLENSEEFAATNQHIVDEYGKSKPGKIIDSITASRFFTPILSAQDAIEHVVDSDPDLAMFASINKSSTRNDLKKIIDKYGVGSAKLKEFIAKLGACIKGIEVTKGKSLFGKLSYKLSRMFGFVKLDSDEIAGIRLLDKDAPLVENLITTITLLAAEYSTKSCYDNAKEMASMDPSKTFDEHYLDMINQQTQDSRDLNNAIARDLEREDNPLKTHLDFSHMNEKGNEALDQVEHIKDPKEFEAELLKQGVAIRELTRGPLSIRTRRFLRKTARVGLTGLSLPFYLPYGIGVGLGALGKYWWKEIFMTEGTKKGGRILRDNVKKFFETPQHIVGLPVFALSKILAWPTNKFRELGNKLKE